MNARDIATCCEFAASQEVLDTESALLSALGYRLGSPTAHTFVEHFTSSCRPQWQRSRSCLRGCAWSLWGEEEHAAEEEHEL